MNFKRVKITTTIPPEDAPKLRGALGKAGAGKVGDYTFCSFSILGEGRSMPNENADPHIGEANKLAVIKEEQIEVACVWLAHSQRNKTSALLQNRTSVVIKP